MVLVHPNVRFCVVHPCFRVLLLFVFLSFFSEKLTRFPL